MRLNRLIILIVLYLGFISLGLPDQVLGISWPSMRFEFNRPLDWAGILVFMTAVLTSFSGFVSGWFINRFAVVAILIVSCILTACGLLGYGLSPSPMFLILSTIPLGLGAGAIDASLNNYVANNYSSRHMNWLHACWGIGSTLGPAIMTYAVAKEDNWRLGYFIIAAIQFTLLLIFIATVKLWQRVKIADKSENDTGSYKISDAAPLLGMGLFFLYSTIEASVGLWFYTVMVEAKNIAPGTAGSLIVLYWGALTVGRIIIGLFSVKLGNRKIITLGMGGAFLGLILLLGDRPLLLMIGLMLTGFSLAGIYPSMMHETPRRFGRRFGAVMMGFQAGIASLGVGLLSPLIGVVIAQWSLNLLIPILLCLMFLSIIMNAELNRRN